MFEDEYLEDKGGDGKRHTNICQQHSERKYNTYIQDVTHSFLNGNASVQGVPECYSVNRNTH